MKLPLSALSVDCMWTKQKSWFLFLRLKQAQSLTCKGALFWVHCLSQSMFSVHEKSLKPNVETVKHSKCCRNQTGFKYDGWSRFSQLKLLHKGPSHHANPPQNATVNILLPGCWPVVLVHRQRGAALCWLQSRIYSLLRTRPQLLSAEKRSNSGSEARKKSQNYQHVPNKKSFFITLASLSWVKICVSILPVCCQEYPAVLRGRSTPQFQGFLIATRSCCDRLVFSYRARSQRWALGRDPVRLVPTGGCF